MSADSHCHLNDPAFKDDRDEVIARARGAGVCLMLNVGYDLATTRVAIDLARANPDMFASVGVHPHNAKDVDGEVIEKMRFAAAAPEVVAIGETGLDYYRDRSPREAQQKAFRAHLALAREVCKPVVIHCRNAMEDCLEILRDEGVEQTGAVMHCFAGTPDDARACLAMNMYISFAGNITYPKAAGLRESLSVVPGHRLLVETDSPYLAPRKKRGKRNEPSLISHVIGQAATTRGVTYEDMERISVSNFKTLFKVGDPGAGEVAYMIRNSLYLNVTRSCDNECYFCARFHSDTVQGHNLRIERDPTTEEMIEAVGDPTRYDEVVFCGYGEPTLRLDRVKEVARAVKAMGGHTRLNTNGHGSVIAGRDITPELVGLVDEVSVSLNAPDADTYNAICNPKSPGAYEGLIEFIKATRRRGLKVTATAVAIEGKVDIEACRRLAENELGVYFRVRDYNLVG